MDSRADTSPRIPFATEEIGADALGPVLDTMVLGRNVLSFGVCDSTQAVARRLLESPDPAAAPPNGTLVVANHQRAGHGRNGRSWRAPPGGALLLSLVLYPSGQTPRAAPQLVTMAAALAAARGLDAVGAPGCSIKWPNDVLAPDGRKLCGIITNRIARAQAPAALVAGVGINVNQAGEDFPPALRDTASSVRLVAGRPVSRLAVLKEFLEAFERCLALDDAALFEAWRSRCATLGRMVRVRTHDRAWSGHAVDLDETGGLVVRSAGGSHQTVHSGDVTEIRFDDEPAPG